MGGRLFPVQFVAGLSIRLANRSIFGYLGISQLSRLKRWSNTDGSATVADSFVTYGSNNRQRSHGRQGPIRNRGEEDSLDSPSDRNENSWLVLDLDSGGTPPGVLVVRELKWPRVVGACFGFLIGIPAAVLATVILVKYGDLASALIFSVFAVLPLSGAMWLWHELLSATYYYVALDDQHFYRRRGARQLLILRLDEVKSFDVRGAAVFVDRRNGQRPILVMKNAYAPENVHALAHRMSAWCAAPREDRGRVDRIVNLQEAQRIRTFGNRQLIVAVRFLGVYSVLIVLSVYLGVFKAPRPVVALWFIFIVVGFLILLAGIVRRVAARRKERGARSTGPS